MTKYKKETKTNINYRLQLNTINTDSIKSCWRSDIVNISCSTDVTRRVPLEDGQRSVMIIFGLSRKQGKNVRKENTTV